MTEIKNELFNCAEKYKELVDKKVTYELEIYLKKYADTCIVEFSFDTSEFKHLIGLGKLKGISDTSEPLYKKLNGEFVIEKKGREIKISAEKMAKSIVNKIVNDDYFYDDVECESILSAEEFKKESEMKKCSGYLFKSSMLDRMYALEHFYETMDKMQLDGTSSISLKMYHWIRTEYEVNERKERPKSEEYYQKQRPHNSTVSADYLLEFQDASVAEKQYTNFFLITNKNNFPKPFSDVSIFRTDMPYSQEYPEYKVNHPKEEWRDAKDDIIILSVTRTMLENGKEVSETKTTDKAVIADCQKRIEERIEREKQSELDREARRNPHEAEKTIATGVLRNLKATRCRDKESKKTEYRKELCHLYEKTDYTLHEIKAVLENSCNSKNNEKYREQMEKEIRLVDSILKTRETIDKITAVEQATTDDNFFEQADKYIELQNKIKSEINCSDMKDVLCHNIAEMLTQHEISNADESIKSTLSMEYMSGFIKYVSDLAEEKSGSVVMRTDFKKPAEFRNINPDGTSTLDIFSSLKQSLYEAGQQIKEYAEKIKDFMKEKAKSFLNLFRKNNADDKPDDTASPTGQGSNSDNGVSDSERKPETEQEESQEQMQENSGKFCYCMEYQIETYDFCQYEENNYSEIIESPKASAGIKAEISSEKWKSMIPQRDIVQPNQEYQYSDCSDNQEQEEEYHEKENDSLDR